MKLKLSIVIIAGLMASSLAGFAQNNPPTGDTQASETNTNTPAAAPVATPAATEASRTWRLVSMVFSLGVFDVGWQVERVRPAQLTFGTNSLVSSGSSRRSSTSFAAAFAIAAVRSPSFG